MFALLNPPRGSHKAKAKRSPAPFISRFPSLSGKSKGSSMSRHRRVRFNFGQNMDVPKPAGIASGFYWKNLNGMIPFVAGVAAQQIVTGLVGKYLPITRGGAGAIGLGLLNAGVVGTVAEKYTSKAFGEGMFLGAMGLTAIKTLQSASTQGVGAAFGLHGAGGSYGEHDYGMDGLSDFANPLKVGNAVPTANSMSQYSMPSPNAVMAPMPDFAIPAGPNLHHQNHQHAAQPQPQNQQQQYEDAAVQAAMSGLSADM